MNQPQNFDFENQESARKKLLDYEKTGKYVFHGSLDDIKSLEPRQAYDYDESTKKMIEHGSPAVFASPFADVAIFRALTNTQGVPGNSLSRFGIDDNGLHFSATLNLLNKAKEKIGKVYVLDKKNFQDFEGMECRSFEVNVPLDIIEVTYNDLPPNIQIISDQSAI